METETITITNADIEKGYIEFTGSKHVNACNMSYFPDTPQKGNQYVLEFNPEDRQITITLPLILD